MPPIKKSAPLYSKQILPSNEVIATALAIGGGTVAANALQALVSGSLSNYTITQSTVDSTPIGFSAPAAANFTNLTTGSPLNGGYDVTFWGSPSSYAKWIASSGLWKISSNGNPNGGLQTDNIFLQQNTISTTVGPLTLNPTGNVVLPTSKPLQFGDIDGLQSTIESNANGGLQIHAAKCINLLPEIAVTIPQGKPLWLDGTCTAATSPFYRSGFWNQPSTGKLVIGGNGGISLSTNLNTSVELSTPNTPLYFGPSSDNRTPLIQGDNANSILNLVSRKGIDLSSPQVTLPPNGHLAWYPFPNSNYIVGGNGPANQQGITFAGGDDDIVVTGNKNIVLGPAQSVIIPNTQRLNFPAASASLGVDDTTNSFLLKSTSSSSSFLFQAGSGITRFPDGQSVYFGNPNAEIQSIQSGSNQVLNITAPEIHLRGNVTVTGGSTSLETIQLIAEDPIIEVGAQLPAGDFQDRGFTSLFADRNDTALRATFMGWQPKLNAFALLGYTHDDGTGHYVPGKWGDLQSGDLTVQSTIRARDPTKGLQLSGSSISIPSATPFLIGNDGAGFLSDPASPYGSTLQVLQSTLQFGTSKVTGGSRSADPLVVANNGGGLAVTAASLTLGIPSPTTPTLQIQDGNQASTPGIVNWQNVNAYNLPSNVPLQWGHPGGVATSPSLVGNATNNTVQVNASTDFYVNAPTLSGPVTWNGNPIGFEYGGTGRNAFTVPWAIPFVNNARSELTETIAFRFDQEGKRILLDDILIAARSILLPSENSTFSFPQGILTVGTSASPVSTTTPRFQVLGSAQVRDTLFLGSSLDRFLVPSTLVGTTDVLIGGSTLVLGGNTLSASQESTSLLFCSSLDFKKDKAITWQSSGGNASITSKTTTKYLELNSEYGISLPSSIDRILQWNGGYTDGETELVGFYRRANTLNYTGSNLTFVRPNATLCFGENNSIRTAGNGGLQLDALTTSIRLNAPQVVIDGDLRVLGTVLETISNTTILDQNIFRIGQGRLLTIQSIIAYGGTNANPNGREVLITTTSVHQLLTQQKIEVVDTNCEPDLEGTYAVNQVISTTQFTLLATLPLTANGSTGVIRAPLVTDPGVDVGIQLGYFDSSQSASANAFWIWRNSTQKFTLYQSGLLQDGIVQNGVLGSLEIHHLQTSSISGFTLQGALNANNQLVSGSSFQITGGNINTTAINDWTTTTHTVVTNLNTDYIRGLTITDFVLRDGSQALTSRWDAGDYSIASQFLEAKNCANTQFYSNVVGTSTPPPLLFSPVFANPADGKLVTDVSYYGYDLATHTLVTSLDVSSSTNNITFRDNQIPGEKVGPGLANCDISGNANTVTDGVYRHDYALPNSVLVSSPDPNNPLPISLPTNTVLGTDANGVTKALSGSDLNQIIGPFVTWERRVATPSFTDAPVLDLTKHLSKVCPSTSAPASPDGVYYAILPNGTVEGQVHRLKGYRILTGQNSIAIKLRYVAPTDGSIKGDVWLYLTNNGQSIELVWDDDEIAWYNTSAGLDVFQV